MAVTVPAGYSHHFYITSSLDNLKWVEDTAKYLESKEVGFKGVFESRDMKGGVPLIELAQTFCENSHKVIIGFGTKHDEREKFKALDTLEEIFKKNEPRDSYRLIPVKLSQESHVPESLRQYPPLETWNPYFKSQLVNSIKFTPHQFNTVERDETPGTSVAHGRTRSEVSIDGLRDSSTTQKAAAMQGRDSQAEREMTEKMNALSVSQQLDWPPFQNVQD